LRFVDLGSGVKNVMKLTKTEITKLRHLERSLAGVRAGPCVRDEADPRILVLSPARRRSARAFAAGRRSTSPNR
jgi:hypothetical protein